MLRFLWGVSVVASFTVFSDAVIAQDPDAYMRYDEFISKVESGEVVSVQLGRFSQITGLYKNGGAEKPFRSYHEDPHSDPLLLALLKEKGVTIQLEKEEEPSIFGPLGIFSSLFMFGLPILTFLFVLSINSKINNLIRARGEGGAEQN